MALRVLAGTARCKVLILIKGQLPTGCLTAQQPIGGACQEACSTRQSKSSQAGCIALPVSVSSHLGTSLLGLLSSRSWPRGTHVGKTCPPARQAHPSALATAKMHSNTPKQFGHTRGNHIKLAMLSDCARVFGRSSVRAGQARGGG